MLFILKEKKKTESFNNLSSKYLVSTYCIPCTILVIDITIENKSDFDPLLSKRNYSLAVTTRVKRIEI